MNGDMPRKMPLHVVTERTRHGKVKFYYRKGKGKRTSLPDEYPSEAFNDAYVAAVAGNPIPEKPAVAARVDSLEWLVRQFMESAKWAATSPATRRQRELFYIKAIKNARNPRYADITRFHVQRAIDDRAATPALAKNLLKALRSLFAWALKSGLIQSNPCDGVEVVPYKTDGFPPWTVEDAVQFCEYWPVGTTARLAFELILTSGLRRGDVHVAGRQHLRGDIFSMRTAKTGAEITVQFPPSLLETIAATRTGDMHFIVKADGQPFGSKESFGNWFSARCRGAGIGKSAHGVRKLAATLSADDGASAHELMSHFGWVKVEQAETYTKKADRKRLGIRSSGRVAGQIMNALPRTSGPGSGSGGNKSKKTAG